MRNHKKLERMMLFNAVAKELSFTTAAKSLDISRGHLSNQITLLEKEMGVALLIRSTRSVRLTQEGQAVFEGMKIIQKALWDIERSTEQSDASIEGLIKITAPRLFCKTFLLDAIVEFKQSYPHVTFSIDCSYSKFDLIESDFDLAIRSTTKPPENMVAKKIFDYQHQCYVSQSYLKTHGPVKSIDDLSNHNCLVDSETTTWGFGNSTIPLKRWLDVNDHELLVKLAVEGYGVIRIADYSVASEVNRKQLIPLFEGAETERYEMYLLYPHIVHRPNRVAMFIQFLQQYLITK
ncbi:LysR family transcriptional regulator (plasmid) [Photobacterium sp. DA100]|uniref:LysR family transcriptional regulator n=1 Tax=Photobacterium sp. DA100 TaxID=3027472 RepID=UPI00247A982E|nr:LysR family transcriptional regulator [Photobacterium sp. DA100]WEM45088.1 LysR family transcriptional regulator [Photobacterium sp. DA100]